MADLLRVRVIREDKAMREVVKAHRKLEEMRAHLEAERKALQEYHDWRVHEEQRRFDEIMHKEIVKKTLENLKVEIAALRDEELAREKRVVDAEIAVQDAEKALEEARLVHLESVKSKQKIEEHQDIWMVQAKKNDEYLLDKELEDVKLLVEHHDDMEAIETYEANEVS
ncbi:MAG TPA: YscO family type III secretion system apparatus protein [Opitutales bacterium]|nr:YscO family type III secretion system apparatus protein [Opitutales bacterium]